MSFCPLSTISFDAWRTGNWHDEAPGQSLQTADLVHEAYRPPGRFRSRVARPRPLPCGGGRGHAANPGRTGAEEAADQTWGRHLRVDLGDAARALGPAPDEVILVSDLLESLASEHPLEAQIVKLHYFGGLNISEAGEALGVSSSTAYNRWRFARAWLHQAAQDEVE